MAPNTNALWENVTAGGTSEPFTLPVKQADGALAVSSVVVSITAGTFQLFADVQDVAGNWQQVAVLTAQTVAGAQSAIIPTLQTAVPQGATDNARLRWTMAGGTAQVILAGVGR